MKFSLPFFLVFFLSACVTDQQDIKFEVLKLDDQPSPQFLTDRERSNFLQKSVPAALEAVGPGELDECPVLPKKTAINQNKLILRIDTTFVSSARVCTGFFVKSDVIATAAHCVKLYNAAGKVEYPSRVDVSAGFYIDENGNARDFGRAKGYRIIFNPRYSEISPGKVTAEQSGEDYTFIVLRNSSLYSSLQEKVVHEFVQPDYTLLGLPPIGGGQAPVIKAGRTYDVIGFPTDETQNSALLTMKKAGPGRAFRGTISRIFSSDHRVYAGNSGGPIRESDSVLTAGIHSSATRCNVRHVLPHEDLLKGFMTAQKMTFCIQTAENECLLKCCDGIDSPNTSVSNCINSCIIK